MFNESCFFWWFKSDVFERHFGAYSRYERRYPYIKGCNSGASQKILWEQVVTCSAHFTENFKTNLAEYWGAVHGWSSSLPDYLTKCFESWCSAAVVSCIGVCYQDKFWFVVYTLLRWRLPRISLTLCNLDCDAEAECFLHLQKKKKREGEGIPKLRNPAVCASLRRIELAQNRTRSATLGLVQSVGGRCTLQDYQSYHIQNNVIQTKQQFTCFIPSKWIKWTVFKSSWRSH